MDNDIKNALEKGKDYLLKKQNDEGYWVSETSTVSKGPEYLQKPIVRTSEIVEALLHLELEDTSSINKGIYYCYKEKVEDTDTIELLSSKLKALSYSNVQYIQKKAKQIFKIILERQNKEGYWPSFPKTSNLTNYLVAESLREYDCKEDLEKLRKWLIEHKAKDGQGWGINESSEKSQVSFTANAILTIFNQEDINNKEIENGIKFLESKQMKDGSWPSSELTYPNESTVYATALVCLILIKTKDNINDKIIESSIKFLLNTQLEDGSWPLKKGESGEYFTTCYAIKTLRYYLYLKERLNNEDIKILIKNSKNKKIITTHLLNEYQQKIRKKFLESHYNLLLDKILATTTSAVKRRKIILEILYGEGEKDTADIIDGLKRLDGYKGLHKRSHLAQIKNDMDALVNLGFIEESHRKYYLVKKVN